MYTNSVDQISLTNKVTQWVGNVWFIQCIFCEVQKMFMLALLRTRQRGKEKVKYVQQTVEEPTRQGEED